MTTSIVIKEGTKMPEKPIIVEGFPSKGFVSTIAARYMIDELGMEQIGHITSDKLGSVAVIHSSTPMRPIRIYAKGNLIVIFSEIMIPIHHMGDFTKALTMWLDEVKPSMVVLLAGMSGKETEKAHEIFGISNKEDLATRLADLKVSRVDEGMLTGISSDLLLHCIERDIPSISLMAETKVLPDPLASASMIEILDKVLGLRIDTKKLVEEGKKIECMVKDITEQMKRGSDNYKQISESYSPQMYG